MTEQQFIEKARERGLREKNIGRALNDYKFIKEKTLPDLELDESIIDIALKTQARMDNRPEGMMSLD